MSRYYPCIYYDRQEGQLIGRCKYYSKDGVQSWCTEGAEDCEHETPSNADRIRAMSDEELAVFLADEIPHGDCYGCKLVCATYDEDQFEDSCQNAFYRWIKQPADLSYDK